MRDVHFDDGIDMKAGMSVTVFKASELEVEAAANT